MYFVGVSEPRGVKNRLHLDIVPDGVSQEQEMARLGSLGARSSGPATWAPRPYAPERGFLQRIAVQHIRMSIGARVPGWSSARSRSAATRVAAESASVPGCSRPLDTRRPSSMLKLTGFPAAIEPSPCPRWAALPRKAP